jgi:hypothetical protein
MRLAYVGATLLAATSLVGCGTPLPPDRAAYAGEWRGTGVTLSISREGSLFFEKVAGGSRYKIKGPIQGFKGDNISVGVLFITSTIDVSQPPIETNGVWTMTVEGVEVTRSP